MPRKECYECNASYQCTVGYESVHRDHCVQCMESDTCKARIARVDSKDCVSCEVCTKRVPRTDGNACTSRVLCVARMMRMVRVIRYVRMRCKACAPSG